MTDMLPDFPSFPLTAEVENLIDQLYMAKRELEATMGSAATGCDHVHPHFVLIARSEDSKRLFEQRLFAYFSHKYGFDTVKPLPYDIHPLTNASTFCFPNGVTISVIRLPEMEK